MRARGHARARGRAVAARRRDRSARRARRPGRGEGSPLAMGRVISIDGALVEAARATISVFDRGLLYGDGCFEVLRTWMGVAVDLEAHLDRLLETAAALRLRGLDRARLRAAVETCVDAAEAATPGEHRIRIVLTRGAGRARGRARHARARPHDRDRRAARPHSPTELAARDRRLAGAAAAGPRAQDARVPRSPDRARARAGGGRRRGAAAR